MGGKTYSGRQGGHCKYFVDGLNVWGGGGHPTIAVGGWVVQVRKYCHSEASSCKLKLA